MIAIPAIDLREGASVQLVGGAYAEERVRLDDPVAVAHKWARLGFRRLHLVDLDAATGRGSNIAIIRSILRASMFDEVQVGGGVRNKNAVKDLLEAGATKVVVGTRAMLDHDWLVELSSTYPALIVVAADVRDRQVVTHGWERALPGTASNKVQELQKLPLAGIMVTAVHREGRMEGPDYHLMEEMMQTTTLPLTASGGISKPCHLRELALLGVSSAVLGMALYTGALDPQATATEFGS